MEISRFFILIPRILQACIWIPTRIFFFFFLRIKIEGREHLSALEKTPGVVFAQNHVSELDVFIVPMTLPFLSRLMPIFYTSREQSFYKNSGWRQFFYGGFFFKIWGAHPLVAGSKNYGVSLATHIQLLKQKKSICIFPEGGRSFDGTLKPARGGVAYLAGMTNTPIVPVATKGMLGISFTDVLFRRREVHVTFLPPVYITSCSDTNPEACRTEAQAILDSIGQTIQKM